VRCPAARQPLRAGLRSSRAVRLRQLLHGRCCRWCSSSWLPLLLLLGTARCNRSRQQWPRCRTTCCRHASQLR
jgi:hypothetical protein